MKSLDTLIVFHLSKEDLKENSVLAQFSQIFHVETCLRHLWITTQDFKSTLEPFFADNPSLPVQIFEGKDAYRFLLQVAAGLESAVIGETDIFGQIKKAWKGFETFKPPLYNALQSWIQCLFEDTKDLRSHYMQGLGGHSYGSLVRKVLSQYPSTRGPTLLIGAGQLAFSVAPYLLESELWIWNRNGDRALALAEKLRPQAKSEIKVLLEDELPQAWKAASHRVLCVPSTSQENEKFPEWENGSLIHLGYDKKQSAPWSGMAHFYSLQCLFHLQGEQEKAKTLQVERAKRFCYERALLRSMSRQLTLPHGWEDLPVFT